MKPETRLYVLHEVSRAVRSRTSISSRGDAGRPSAPAIENTRMFIEGREIQPHPTLAQYDGEVD